MSAPFEKFYVHPHEDPSDFEYVIVTHPWQHMAMDQYEVRRKFIEDAIREKLEREREKP